MNAADRIDHDRHDVPDPAQRLGVPVVSRETELLVYILASPVIYAAIVWGIPLLTAGIKLGGDFLKGLAQ